jgi:hypothetical protein
MAEKNDGSQEVTDSQATPSAADKKLYWDISTAMFGSVFDSILLRLSSGVKPNGKMLDRVLKQTSADPSLNGTGVEAVIKAARNPEWAERCFSPYAQTALARYAQRAAEAKRSK